MPKILPSRIGKKPFTFYMDNDLHQQIKVTAAKFNMLMADICIEAITEKLDKMNNENITHRPEKEK